MLLFLETGYCTVKPNWRLSLLHLSYKMFFSMWVLSVTYSDELLHHLDYSMQSVVSGSPFAKHTCTDNTVTWTSVCLLQLVLSVKYVHETTTPDTDTGGQTPHWCRHSPPRPSHVLHAFSAGKMHPRKGTCVCDIWFFQVSLFCGTICKERDWRHMGILQSEQSHYFQRERNIRNGLDLEE